MNKEIKINLEINSNQFNDLRIILSDIIQNYKSLNNGLYKINYSIDIDLLDIDRIEKLIKFNTDNNFSFFNRGMIKDIFNLNCSLVDKFLDVNELDTSGSAILIYDSRYNCFTCYYSEGLHNENEIKVYRFDIAKSIDNWINLEKVKSFTGQNYNLENMDIKEFCQLYLDVGNYYGFINLDQSPDIYTINEVEKLWLELNELNIYIGEL